MTTNTPIPNSAIDQDSPGTQELFTLLRDNPISMAEADSTVPLNLLPTVYLGSISTASGTSQTLSGLVLTPFRTLIFVPSVVLSTGGTPQAITLLVAGCTIFAQTQTNPTLRGWGTVDLAGGIGSSTIAPGLGAAPASAQGQGYAIRTSLTAASTSISAGCTGTSTSFNGGDVRVYGVK